MKDFDAFKILKISTNSSIEDIKKSFRKLIILHHPDSYYSAEKDDSYAGILIDAYKKALLTAGEREKNRETDLKASFRNYYSYEMPVLENVNVLYSFLFNLLTDIKNIFYSKNNLPFFRNLISFLKKYCDKNGSLNLPDIFFSGMLILVNSRSASFETNFKEEYEFEKVRKNLIQFITEILDIKNYFEFRKKLNSGRDMLMNDIIYAMKKAVNLIYKEELSAVLLIMMILSEEEFFDKLYEAGKKEKL